MNFLIVPPKRTSGPGLAPQLLWSRTAPGLQKDSTYWIENTFINIY